jgi:hypothetical protein
MPRWRVEMPPLRSDAATLPVDVEADSVAIAGGALVFMDLGHIVRALAPGQWLHLTLLGDDAPDDAGDRYTAATTQACR